MSEPTKNRHDLILRMVKSMNPLLNDCDGWKGWPGTWVLAEAVLDRLMKDEGYPVTPTLPPEVIAWRDAFAGEIASLTTYNDRVRAIQERVEKFPNEFGRDSPNAEYDAYQDAAVKARNLIRPMFDALCKMPDTPSADPSRPDDLRERGWTVAVHNDYHIGGEAHTFWLLTKDGRAIKGEAKTDAEALNQVRAQVQMQPEAPPECATEAEKRAFGFGWWKALEGVQNRLFDSCYVNPASNGCCERGTKSCVTIHTVKGGK